MLSPATHEQGRFPALHAATLNEGRDVKPGDTGAGAGAGAGGAARSTKAGMLSPATREAAATLARPDERRSTKAGMLSPATPGGRNPRTPGRTTLNEGRDVKPGDTSAMREVNPWGTIRSTKAGMLSPATQPACVNINHLAWALNEGRDVKPGDTSASTYL